MRTGARRCCGPQTDDADGRGNVTMPIGTDRRRDATQMHSELTLPFPTEADPSGRAVWSGTEFSIGNRTERILAYDVGDSGWTDDLTRLHEVVAGSDHFIDVASRAHALDEVRRSITSAEPTILEVGC